MNSAIDFHLVLFTSSQPNYESDNDRPMNNFQSNHYCSRLWGRKRKTRQYVSMDMFVTESRELIFLRLLTRHAKLMPKINMVVAI